MSLITWRGRFPVPVMSDSKSKMAESCLSKNDMQLVFKRLRAVNTNKVCNVGN